MSDRSRGESHPRPQPTDHDRPVPGSSGESTAATDDSRAGDGRHPRVRDGDSSDDECRRLAAGGNVRSAPPRRERDQFSSEAAVRSQVRRVNGGELFPPEERAIDAYFSKPDARTLDLGCGSGRVTKALSDRGFDVTGVDISGAQLRAARPLLPEVPLVRSDVANLPFPSNSVQYAVFAYNGLDYLIPRASREAALREVRRVLRPSGVFLYSSHNRWYTLPALVLDHEFVVDKYLRAANAGRLFDRFKVEDAAAGDLETFFSDPLFVRRELDDAGFDLVDVVGTRRFPVSLVEYSPYYAARPA